MIYYEESVQQERYKLKHFFTRKELRMKIAKNPVTLESLVEKHHQLRLSEQYIFGVPPNVIQPKSIVAIMRASKL